MRHRKDLAKLGRPRSHRRATVQALVRSLVLHDRINTTLARAKAAQRMAERLVSRSRPNDLAARRYAYVYLKDHALVKRLFDEVRPRFEDRDSGFTRIFITRNRLGDGSQMAILEMTVKGETKKKEKGSRQKAAAAAKSAKPSKPSKPSRPSRAPKTKEKEKTVKPGKKEGSLEKKAPQAKKKPSRKSKSE